MVLRPQVSANMNYHTPGTVIAPDIIATSAAARANKIKAKTARSTQGSPSLFPVCRGVAIASS